MQKDLEDLIYKQVTTKMLGGIINVMIKLKWLNFQSGSTLDILLTGVNTEFILTVIWIVKNQIQNNKKYY
jgi:hypothetical protein